MVIVADLDLEDLNWARKRGAVRNLRDICATDGLIYIARCGAMTGRGNEVSH
jgi:hypothetical protein